MTETLTTLADYQAALRDIEERLAPLYRERLLLREEMATRFEIDMPRRVYRTPKQELVARCPRCGGQIREETHEQVK